MSFERYTSSVAQAEAQLAAAVEVHDDAIAERARIQALADAKSAEVQSLRSDLSDGKIPREDAAALARLLEADL